MGNETEASFEIDLREIFLLLKSKILYIIASAIVLALIAFVFSYFLLTPQYQASVNMIVNTRQENATNMTTDNINSASRLVPTYAIILKSNKVLNQVIDNLGLPYSYESLSGRIHVESLNDTQVMRVSVEGPDRVELQNIIESIIEIAPGQIVDAVEAGSCKVISDVAVSNQPISPNIPKNVVLGGLLGAVLSVGIIILKELMHNYVTDDADIQKYLNLPVLGVIPYIDADETGRGE